MIDMLKRFWSEEDGLGTVEIVLILAVLVTIALLFRGQIVDFVRTSLKTIFEGAGEGVKTTPD